MGSKSVQTESKHSGEWPPHASGANKRLKKKWLFRHQCRILVCLSRDNNICKRYSDHGNEQVNNINYSDLMCFFLNFLKLLCACGVGNWYTFGD